jgi:hypothetical protein
MMAIHYHGLPLTPTGALDRLAGKHVCVSFATARPSQTEWALRRAQGIMWDNGAFSAFTQGQAFDEGGFYAWVEPFLAHPHWAVVPDVIDGSIEQQRELAARWPFDRALGAPVWHLALPLDYLLELADAWPRVCLGSSGVYWQIGSAAWQRRMDEVFEYLAKHRRTVPWVHGLRMLGQIGDRWPMASADSTNVARNYKDNEECPGCMSHRIDIINGPLRWERRQMELLG